MSKILFATDPNFDLDSLISYVDYKSEYDDILFAQSDIVAISVESLVDLFYKQIMENKIARKIIEETQTTLSDLKKKQAQWILQQFKSPLDQTYYLTQRNIGTRHIEVNLPHSFMVLGINVIKTSLGLIFSKHLKDNPDTLRLTLTALNKKMDVSLAIMLKSYQDSRDQLNEEKVLIENESILALGRMSASIAHEIKNPLAGINGAVQVLRDKLPKNHQDVPIMDSILEQIKRLTGTVNDLLDFARPIKLNVQITPLNEIIRSLDSILNNDPDFMSQITYSDDKTELLNLKADPLRIQNVFYNLFINANEACEGRGTITLSSNENSHFISVIVHDNGPGIPEDWQPHLFKPFATNKVNGTGLGLAICKKIMDAHRGYIHYLSTDEGTCFRLDFPKD